MITTQVNEIKPNKLFTKKEKNEMRNLMLTSEMCATQSNAVAIVSRFRIVERRNRMTDALFWREMSVSISASNRIPAHTPNMRTYIRLVHTDTCGTNSPHEIHVFTMVHSFAAKCYYVLLSHLAFHKLANYTSSR